MKGRASNGVTLPALDERVPPRASRELRMRNTATYAELHKYVVWAC